MAKADVEKNLQKRKALYAKFNDFLSTPSHRLMQFLIVIHLSHVVSEAVGMVLKGWGIMQAVGVAVIRL